MSASFSPSWSPVSSRPQFGSGISRLRSSSSKKPPEPLRRAVADCLSSSSAPHHVGPSTAVSEALRTLRDYLAVSTTIDLAYSVILEHTLAERERSPAVVARCVALLKRYLLRYKPSEETLQQIDRFCVNTIAECDISFNRRLPPWSQSVSQQSGASVASTNVHPSLPVSSFASAALVKSMNYIRSLVDQYIPRRSFQPAAFAGAPSSSRQSLPTLSSLLSRSFNSHISPANGGESSEIKDDSTFPVPNMSNIEKVDGMEDFDYIAVDVLKWRWPCEQQLSFISNESDRVLSLQDISAHNFLEGGAAALLVGDMETKKGQTWSQSGTTYMPYLDQMLQPSSVTTATNSASARPHLKAITASKRSKQGPHQIWKDSFISTFRPHARQLFQYRHYSEQQPLRLNTAEVCEVIAAVCSETSSSNATLMMASSRLSKNSGKPLMDVAVSVLIKLVIDMYVLDSGTAAPLTLSMLEEMISSPISASRTRAFDLILNLGVHSHLLEPMSVGSSTAIEDDYSQEMYFDNESQFATQMQKSVDSSKMEAPSAIEKFEMWILSILFEILLLLVQIEEKEESVWASALSCFLYFVCAQGKIRRNRLNGLDIRVIKTLLEISRKNCWAEVVHCKLICMFTNMFYQVSDGSTDSIPSSPIFLVDQVDIIGGVEFVLLEYSLANSREERRNLYLVLFDFVLHQINETCIATGVSEYSDDEIQPLALLLTLADAPEAFYISVKLGIEGVGEILRRSISNSLSKYPNSERLNVLLENVTGKLDSIISSFTHLDKEFSNMTEITRCYKFFKNIEDEDLGSSIAMKAKLSWATLHSLLHSARTPCRQNAYIWLVDLLIAEISKERDVGGVWSNIQTLQQQIAFAGINDSSAASDIPLPVWLLCGLLKSKHNVIRFGFLLVLERLLMRCKVLLDEKLQHTSSLEGSRHANKDSRLEKANAMIDIMSSALYLVVQINETDSMIILKMCDILFSQLCLKVLPASSTGDSLQQGKVYGYGKSMKTNAGEHFQKQDDYAVEESMGKFDARSESDNDNLICETASMAAMLLQGHAIVPMQLVSRVPVALFDWPLIQLADAATDNISLGVAVGSKGRGNLPGSTSDIRAALLLLLIGKCTADSASFQDFGGEEFFRGLLGDTDSRVAYYSSAFLLKRMMTEEPEKYQRMLQNLVFKAQQSNNEKLLENPYLQMRGILQLSNDLGAGL